MNESITRFTEAVRSIGHLIAKPQAEDGSREVRTERSWQSISQLLEVVRQSMMLVVTWTPHVMTQEYNCELVIFVISCSSSSSVLSLSSKRLSLRVIIPLHFPSMSCRLHHGCDIRCVLRICSSTLSSNVCEAARVLREVFISICCVEFSTSVMKMELIRFVSRSVELEDGSCVPPLLLVLHVCDFFFSKYVENMQSRA